LEDTRTGQRISEVMSGKSHAENRSRDKFEAAMLSRYKSMEVLFKAFERYPKEDRLMPGKYVRGEVQSLWEGWELHRHSQCDRGAE
jgi:hypothetical protein